MRPRSWPLSFLILAAIGLLCLIAGLLSLAGALRGWHPLFNDSAAGIMLLVSAIALFVTAGFPLVLRGLAEKDGNP